MSPRVVAAAETLNDFLFQRVYDVHSARKETEKAREIVRFLYRYYVENEAKLPPEYRLHGDTTARKAVDYIAGMTDQYALNMAEELRK